MTKYKEILQTLPKSEDLTNIELTWVERDNMKQTTSAISHLNKLIKAYSDLT